MDAQLLEMVLRPFARMVAEEIVAIREEEETPLPQEPSRKLKGIPGIMEIFKCSRCKAIEMKASGELDEAIINYGGRSFLIDEQKALAIKEKKQGGRRYSR